MTIWHGDNDTKLVPRNAAELRDQWTAVHGLDQNPDRTSTIGSRPDHEGAAHRVPGGAADVEVNRVPKWPERHGDHGHLGHPALERGRGRRLVRVYRDGARVATPTADPFTDTGLSAGSSRVYSVAAWDAAGTEGVCFAEITATTQDSPCRTANNWQQVQAGRATTNAGCAYAKGSNQNMGLYNTFGAHTLKESPVGYYVIADGNCS
ncbi:hypothetical protein [Streptomyces bobili]|uniref:hypothetical protein n=1 Tax=Streptomyces bobili TaxID=67280 RepID=UPI0038095FA5